MLVILHGWSDSARSFARLGRELVRAGIVSGVRHIRLGDYVSMDDDVTFDDLGAAMEEAWRRERLPTSPRSADLVVHSTGSLVARHWMTRYRTPESNPVHRMVMLAPANFGSPIAHKGRSFLGRIVKGFTSDKLFQTGTQILRGLELASPFTWELAERDRFGEDQWYGPGRILASVIVGTTGYDGISAAANENGTDGTVRVSTADLNPGYLRMDFAADPQKPTVEERLVRGVVALARAPRENHSTVAFKDRGPSAEETLDLIRAALSVEDAGFVEHCARFEGVSREARDAAVASRNRFSEPYQNTVVRLVDSFGRPIRDFFLEVFMKTPGTNRVDDQLTRRIQERVIDTVHANAELPSHRSLLFNTAELTRLLSDQKRPLYISVTAMPDIRKTKSVGYSTFGYDDIGSIKVRPEMLSTFFRPDRTLLVELRLRREQTDGLFEIRSLEQ